MLRHGERNVVISRASSPATAVGSDARPHSSAPQPTAACPVAVRVGAHGRGGVEAHTTGSQSVSSFSMDLSSSCFFLSSPSTLFAPTRAQAFLQSMSPEVVLSSPPSSCSSVSLVLARGDVVVCTEGTGGGNGRHAGTSGRRRCRHGQVAACAGNLWRRWRRHEREAAAYTQEGRSGSDDRYGKEGRRKVGGRRG